MQKIDNNLTNGQARNAQRIFKATYPATYLFYLAQLTAIDLCVDSYGVLQQEFGPYLGHMYSMCAWLDISLLEAYIKGSKKGVKGVWSTLGDTVTT